MAAPGFILQTLEMTSTVYPGLTFLGFSPRLSPLSLSDLQALEHVSQPDNKPAKRGGKNHVMVVHMIAESDIDGR